MKRILLMLAMAALMAACTGCWSSAPEPTSAPTDAPVPTAATTAAPTGTVMPASTDALPTEGAGDAAPLATAEATSGTAS